MGKATLLRLRPQLLFRNIMFSVVVGMPLLLAGCVYDPLYYGPPPRTSYYPHYYDYYYYPSAHVYFQFTTGLYFYLDSGVWVTARVLPPHIHIDPRDRVRIQVETDKPYQKFPEHKRIYKPGPDYRPDNSRSEREREANKRWYREFEQNKDRNKKGPDERKGQDRFR